MTRHSHRLWGIEFSFVTFLLSAIVLGCGGGEGASPDPRDCLLSTDCAPGQVCSLGVCTLDSMAPDTPSTGMDAGRVPVPVLMDDAGMPQANEDAGDEEPCPAPLSCADLGAECGPVEDGCGGFVDCGDCTAPETCGGGGIPNQCGTGSTGCVPTTCQTLGAECGDLGDGCGGALACGGCPSDHACNGNRCLCIPKSCAELGATCGNPDDGCGAPLDCGTCVGTRPCGGGGIPYQCGCVDEGPTPWVEFGRARNVRTSSGSVDWTQVDDAERINRNGARLRVIGGCRYDNQCNCCIETETKTRISEYLTLDRASLAVPANATIRGIEVQVPMRMVGGGPARFRRLNLVGPATSNNLAGSADLNLAQSYQDFTFGGATQRWGRSWTAREVNDPDFGIRIQTVLSDGCSRVHPCEDTRFFVDGARVRVHYRVCE